MHRIIPRSEQSRCRSLPSRRGAWNWPFASRASHMSAVSSRAFSSRDRITNHEPQAVIHSGQSQVHFAIRYHSRLLVRAMRMSLLRRDAGCLRYSLQEEEWPRCFTVLYRALLEWASIINHKAVPLCPVPTDRVPIVAQQAANEALGRSNGWYYGLGTNPKRTCTDSDGVDIQFSLYILMTKSEFAFQIGAVVAVILADEAAAMTATGI
ncbi:hypothetical protein EDD37DRAFT_605446 [Exophiala viscosa]|uniref:Uncharacterized protein n=1 Tax=Exophiala viscosa TaxID=2486360 RepID=A0AAN6E4W3_9EURO|nr:hypothetical protein EDD36DRAFT_413193 [Exophiala viscosa]KAI1626610.1 hypothetical protein EDD37DRAFT_605446 [Exophiala viscosa]